MSRKILWGLIGVFALGMAHQAGAGDLPTPVATDLVIEHLNVFSRVPEDPEAKLAFYENLAQRGNVHAQMNLGFMLVEGDLVRQDFARAFPWFEKAAQQGNPLAQLNLAIMLEKGLGTQRNAEAALEWYEKAARKGNPRAQLEVGKKLEMGDPPLCNEAAGWYEKAIRQGYAEAHLALGRLYDIGCGVRQDAMRAQGAYRTAAEKGIPDAAYQLGLFYKSKGDNVRNLSGRDLIAARMWFLVAQGMWGQDAKAGSAGGMAASLGDIMTDMEKDAADTQAKSWLAGHGFMD